MPFESKAQHKKFRVMEKDGEMPKGTASRWAHETKDMKHLPEHKRKAKARKGKKRKMGRGGGR